MQLYLGGSEGLCSGEERRWGGPGEPRAPLQMEAAGVGAQLVIVVAVSRCYSEPEEEMQH